MIRIRRPSYVAAGVLVLGVVLLAYGAWLGAETALLALDGETVTGTVVSKDIEQRTNSKGQVDAVYLVHYSFALPDESSVQGESVTGKPDWSGLTVGGPIPITYVRLAPASMNVYSAPEQSAGTFLLLAIVLGTGLAFSFVGGRLTWTFRRETRLRRGLIARGISTTGTVLDNKAARLWIRGNLQRRLRYSYHDRSGHQWTGLSSYMLRADAVDAKAGSKGIVRYDPDRPGVSAWFGLEDPARQQTHPDAPPPRG